MTGSFRGMLDSQLKAGVILLLAGLFMSAEALADLPSRDPSVQAMRERFKRGHVPSEAELGFGRSWRCAHRSALQGSHEYGWFSSYFVFAAGEEAGTVRHLSSSQAPVFRFTPTALIGEYEFGGEVSAIDHVRAGDDGVLLVETTSPNCFDPLACVFFGWVQARAIDNYWQGVIAYRECVLEDAL